MDIEEVGALQIVRSELGRDVSDWTLWAGTNGMMYLSKVNLVKDDLVGMADAKESGEESEKGNDGQG